MYTVCIVFASASRKKRVIVAGAGPAGLALARELALRDCDVAVVSPRPRQRWHASYATWARGMPHHDFDEALVGRYPSALVHGKSGRRIVHEEYLRFSTARLQELMLRRAEDAGVQLVNGRLSNGDVAQEPDVLYVDATGSGHLNENTAKPCCFQSAFGVWLEPEDLQRCGTTTEALGIESGCVGLMDYRTYNVGVGQHAPEKLPSFLYAMQECGEDGESRVFLQETVLVARERVAMALLRERLMRRLDAMGLDGASLVERGEVERCVIPMGAMPQRGLPNVLPFGAAAGLIHPATGYQFARSQTLAPAVAEALCEAWTSCRVDNAAEAVVQAVDAGYGRMWPVAQRKAWELYRWGALTLSKMSEEEMQAFVEAFFKLPAGRWLAFMEGTQVPSEILRTMWQVFVGAPKLRLSLIKNSSSTTSVSLLQAFS